MLLKESTYANYNIDEQKSAHAEKLPQFTQEFEELFNDFLVNLKSCEKMYEYERVTNARYAVIEFSRRLNDYNRRYRREILDVSPDYKRAGLFAFTYAGKDLVDVVGRSFKFKFVSNRTERQRVKYTPHKLYTAVVLATTFLLKKYHNPHIFQIKATFLKVILDLFDYATINYQELEGVMQRLFNTDMEYFNLQSEIIGINDKIKPEPVKEDKVKRPRKPRKKTELPGRDAFEYWLTSGMTYTEIKSKLAVQYGVTEKTIQRRMAEYGLTRKYTKTSK